MKIFKDKEIRLYPIIVFIYFLLMHPCYIKSEENVSDSKQKIAVSLGINYALGGSWSEWGRIRIDGGFGLNLNVKYIHFLNSLEDKGVYFGVEVDHHRTQSRIIPTLFGNQEIDKYYETHSESNGYFRMTDNGPVYEYIQEYLGDPITNPNAKFNNKKISLIIFLGKEFRTKIGKPFIEVGLVLGKAWYKADYFIQPDIYKSFDQSELNNIVTDTKKLHSVDSEIIYAYKLSCGIWPSFKMFSGEIGLAFSYMQISAIKYYRELTSTYYYSNSNGSGYVGTETSKISALNPGYISLDVYYRFQFKKIF